MDEDVRAVLEWEYTPSDFFEETVQIDAETGRIAIENGRARGTFDASGYMRGAEFRDEMHELLRREFISQQVFSQRAFQLNKPGMTREHSNGRRDTKVFLETGHYRLTGHPVDITITTAKGNVIRDTRAERLAERRDFRDKLAKLAPEHPELDRILDSFRMSLEDEQNCFVHLYEILDALAKALGGVHSARAVLGGQEWRELGRLANHNPNAGSRHRGKHASLQPASDEELKAGRDYARMLIQAYVDYLECSKSG